jgi:hypothetical protein
MLRILTAFLALALWIGAQTAHSQSQPAKALDPVGVYDLDLERGGQFTGAEMTIERGKDGGLSATMQVHGQSIVFDKVTVEDRVVTLDAGTGLTLTLTFRDRDNLSGTWNRPDDSGSLNGVRRKG